MRVFKDIVEYVLIFFIGYLLFLLLLIDYILVIDILSLNSTRPLIEITKNVIIHYSFYYIMIYFLALIYNINYNRKIVNKLNDYYEKYKINCV